jgi:cysteinyl-tRNA synthetase
MLRLHNSLTGKVEQFIPMVPGQVRMYVCGITVYDYCHLGHMRMMVVFDVVRRWLRASGYAVTFVRNITDIDDKIIQRAAANHESIDALTARFIAAMDEDGAQLGIERIKGFVKQQHRGFEHESPSDGDALAHATFDP